MLTKQQLKEIDLLVEEKPELLQQQQLQELIQPTITTTTTETIIITKHQSLRRGPPSNKVPVNCTFCTKPFLVYQSRIDTANRKFNGNIYCSKDCSINNREAFYEKFYHCDYCNKGIPKDKAVMYKGYLRCPKVDCNNNKLKKTNTRYKNRVRKKR